MRILITGATGFIGSHVAVAFAKAGHGVLATGRDPRKVPALGRVPGIRLGRLDLSDPSNWGDLMQGIEVLVHVALGWGDNGPDMLKNDTAASIGLFEAARAAGVQQVIYTSSTAANGEMEALNSESRQTRPVDFYGATKASTENFLRAYASYKAFKVQVIRPGYIFGEPVVEGARSQPDTRFKNMAENLRQGRPLRLTRHDGTQFLHAGDLTQVYLAVLDRPEPFALRYALARAWRSWEEVARLGMQAAGRQVALELEDKGYAAQPFIFDVEAIRRDLGLEFDNLEALKRHLAWEMAGRA